MTKRDELDETDLKILKLLRSDARLSFREIGKQIHVSTGTVSDRVRNLQERGVIKGFVTAVAPEKMGYNVTMMLELKIKHDMALSEFEMTLHGFEEASCIHYVTGDWDMMVLMRCTDQNHAAELLDKVRTLEAVQACKSHMVMKSCNLCGQCGCDCAWDAPHPK
ncbi:MAG: Lrp/AsnC family transcriptional regulator [Thermoplasmata archaeon]|nr:Lrp/AsnC family transcriptional regulator [Thermoplasmata archaeon]